MNDAPQHYLRYSTSGGCDPVDARVVEETSVGLSVNGIGWLSFLCTPTALEELGIGFLFNEGIITHLSEVVDAQICADETHIDIWLNHAAAVPDNWRRTSGCGGGATNPSAPLPARVTASARQLDPEKLLACMDALLNTQDHYRETGGIHCSAISDGEQIIFKAEDIGRHNTFDKLAGMRLRSPQLQSPCVILTTGRISSEMIQKAARIGAEFVLSRTSPTSESIRIAEQAGITLCGYVRRSQANIYTHPERIAFPPL